MERRCVLMAYDKAVDSQALDGALGAVADAIRGKTGRTEPMTLEQMPGEISGIQTGAVLPELRNPGSAEDLMEGKQLIGSTGDPIVGTFTLVNELAEQGALIDRIKTVLAGKVVSGAAKPEQEMTVEITDNGTVEFVPYKGHVLSKVTVNVSVESSGGDPELPPGYWRCDYILFSGEQIIDTARICTKRTRIRVDFTRERSAQHYLYGVASSDNTASVTAYLGGSWRFGSKATTKTITARSDMVYSAIISSSEATITGSATSLSSVNEFETVGSLLIGTCRSASGAVGDPQFEGKIMRFQMDDEDEPVLHLVPVTDGTAFRFWDSVGKKFHDSITDTPLVGGNW